jgi:hypothetical protein
MYILHGVGDISLPFLPPQMAKPSSMIVLKSRNRVGCRRKWFIAPLYCTVALIVDVKVICYHRVNDVPYDVIEWRSGYQDS